MEKEYDEVGKEPSLFLLIPLLLCPVVGVVLLTIWGMYGLAVSLILVAMGMLFLLPFAKNLAQRVGVVIVAGGFIVIGMSVLVLEVTQ